MTKTTVENGKAIAKINTHNYKKGNYRIRVQYPQNNSYYASTELTKVDGDTTDGNQWSAYSDSWEIYTTSAHSSCDEQGVHSGTYRHILWKTKLKLGMVLNVHGTVTNDNRFILMKITDEAGSNRTIDISKDVGSTTVYYNDGTNTETLGTVSYGGNGEFTLSLRTFKNPDREWELTLNGETVHIPYKPEFADGYYYSFRKWGNGEILVDEISYSTSSLLNIEPPTPYEYVLSEFSTSRDYATETNTLGSNSAEPSYNNDILNLGIRYDVIMNKPLTVDGSKYYKINAHIDPYTRIGILHDGQCPKTYPYVWGYNTISDVEMTLLFENGRAFIIIDGKKKRLASNINPSNTNRLTFVSLSNNNTVTSIKEYPDTEYTFTEDKFHQLPLNYYTTDTTYCTSQNIDTSTIRPPSYDDTGDFPVLDLGWRGNVNINQTLTTDESKYYVVRGYLHPYDRIGLRFNNEFNAKVLQNMGFTEEGEYTIVFTKRSGNLYMIVHDTESLRINGWNSNNASYQLSFAPVSYDALLYKVVECDTGKLPLYRELWNTLPTESTTTDRTELTYTNNDTVQIGRYCRNILTVPFTPTGECVVTFRHGRGAYLGIKLDTDASNSTGCQAVELSLGNSFKPCEVNTLRMVFNNGKVTFILNEHTIKTVDYTSNVAYIYASQSNGISPLEILDIEANTNGGGVKAMKTVVDYGTEGSPFTLTTGKPFTWNRYSEGIDPHINSDGSLDMGKNISATYYIPNSNSDWKMICNFDKNISDSYLEIGYHSDNNSTRRKFSFFSNKTEMNEGNDVATHPQIRNTEQYVTIERQGNSIILQYPTENGVETITTPYVGTVNHRLAIQNHGTGNVTIKQFIYYDQNGGQAIGTSQAYGGIYQQFILGNAKGEGSPFYTLNESVIPATVTSGNILNIGSNQRIDYDLPTNVNANWTATYDFKMFPHDTKEIYFQFLSNDNEYARGIRFFTNRSTFKRGSGESVTYPALTDDTDKQNITYTKRGSVLTIEYPDIEGNITRIATEFMGTASFRLRVTDNDSSPLNCITMFTFSYIN